MAGQVNRGAAFCIWRDAPGPDGLRPPCPGRRGRPDAPGTPGRPRRRRPDAPTPRAPGDPRWRRFARGWNRGRARRVLTETPMDPGVFRRIRAIVANDQQVSAGVRSCAKQHSGRGTPHPRSQVGLAAPTPSPVARAPRWPKPGPSGSRSASPGLLTRGSLPSGRANAPGGVPAALAFPMIDRSPQMRCIHLFHHTPIERVASRDCAVRLCTIASGSPNRPERRNRPARRRGRSVSRPTSGCG